MHVLQQAREEDSAFIVGRQVGPETMVSSTRFVSSSLQAGPSLSLSASRPCACQSLLIIHNRDSLSLGLPPVFKPHTKGRGIERLAFENPDLIYVIGPTPDRLLLP